MALLDVRKVFDSVNHEMLCEKIQLDGIELDWFISYLKSRKQMFFLTDTSICNSYTWYPIRLYIRPTVHKPSAWFYCCFD